MEPQTPFPIVHKHRPVRTYSHKKARCDELWATSKPKPAPKTNHADKPANPFDLRAALRDTESRRQAKLKQAQLYANVVKPSHSKDENHKTSQKQGNIDAEEAFPENDDHDKHQGDYEHYAMDENEEHTEWEFSTKTPYHTSDVNGTPEIELHESDDDEDNILYTPAPPRDHSQRSIERTLTQQMRSIRRRPRLIFDKLPPSGYKKLKRPGNTETLTPLRSTYHPGDGFSDGEARTNGLCTVGKKRKQPGALPSVGALDLTQAEDAPKQTKKKKKKKTHRVEQFSFSPSPSKSDSPIKHGSPVPFPSSPSPDARSSSMSLCAQTTSPAPSTYLGSTILGGAETEVQATVNMAAMLNGTIAQEAPIHSGSSTGLPTATTEVNHLDAEPPSHSSVLSNPLQSPQVHQNNMLTEMVDNALVANDQEGTTELQRSITSPEDRIGKFFYPETVEVQRSSSETVIPETSPLKQRAASLPLQQPQDAADTAVQASRRTLQRANTQ
ncbi:hypothetical protein QBC46DRAFT_434176 [Diplogelasinospora grovesii]|uniref:Uncharacterized protein n=1 Tax=Diplogelasinospora grovesii TaxID=303347 RepID=A0AAN6N7K9_9PEZI|nr:hypothetical protein QBC46DRAFT_434176 [Diplogelasinospora grovesii]